MASPFIKMTRYDHFYDEQIRRFEMQLVRAFSGWQYKLGPRNGQEGALKLVPCTMAKRDKQVASILRSLSENTLMTVPMITIAKTGMVLTPERLQNPQHTESIHITERARDPVTGYYTGERGNAMTVERIMPRPFELKYQVDIWTSNEDQKHQLMEQILTVIYPSFDIQSSDNPLDWSALTSVYVEDVNFYSRGIPIGTSEDIEIATINLRLPFWLTPPAKIKHQTIIKQIITNVNAIAYDEDGEAVQGEKINQVVTTFKNHCISVENGEIKLLGPHGNEKDEDGNIYRWEDLMNAEGIDFYPLVTQLHLRLAENLEDDSKDIKGTIQLVEPNVMAWQVDLDTLPANTLDPIHAAINPLRSVPGEGGIVAAENRRYLLTEDLAGPSAAWGNITASKWSIIKFKQGAWIVDFDIGTTEEHFVTNLLTGRQLRWTGGRWTMAVNNVYGPGYWQIAA
jgi:hypothetical protein